MSISLSRRATLATFTGLLATVVAGRASAQQAPAKAKFTKAAFEAAQAQGKAILVEISAPWCPTCRAQKPIIGSLMANPAYAAVTVFEIDFDSQGADVRALKAQSQSTLIAFKGKNEKARSVGETKADAIESLFKAII